MLGAAAADFQDQVAVDEFGLSRLGIPDILWIRGGIRRRKGRSCPRQSKDRTSVRARGRCEEIGSYF